MKDDYWEDDTYDNNCQKQDRHSLEFSLSVLVVAILIVIRLLALADAQCNKLVMDTSEPYVMSCQIISVDYIEGNYYIVVEGYHDNILESHQVKISKYEYMTLKKGQSITIEVKGGNCSIVN